MRHAFCEGFINTERIKLFTYLRTIVVSTTCPALKKGSNKSRKEENDPS
jgi:hypothetical protein